MNHLNAITAQLDTYQLDALCITSQGSITLWA